MKDTAANLHILQRAEQLLPIGEGKLDEFNDHIQVLRKRIKGRKMPYNQAAELIFKLGSFLEKLDDDKLMSLKRRLK